MKNLNKETKEVLLDIIKFIEEKKGVLRTQQQICIDNNMELEEKVVFSKLFEINEIRSYIVMEYLRK